MMNNYHNPVMLNECLQGLNIIPEGVYVDVTFGGGGHSKAILNLLNKKGKLIAFDQDADAKKNITADSRLIFIDQNFEYLKNHIQYQNLLPVDGILADLGVSSYQFDIEKRGFSYRFEESVLDMRMNNATGKTAADYINTLTELELADILYYYGELNKAKAMAKQLVAYRNIKPITTVADLKKALSQFAPKFNDYKFWSPIFQALRIHVNRELDVLKKFLLQTEHTLKPGGRLVIMSYHSLEDRLVKNFINSGNFTGELNKDIYGNVNKPFTALSKKAITASDVELENNSRSRSAKLRIAIKN